ncbi:hypothetical protein JXJ21_25250 [candidate division KSB1 bacterium]|nr:hypothetical protein [candidate division KSB1 bacterium]
MAYGKNKVSFFLNSRVQQILFLLSAMLASAQSQDILDRVGMKSLYYLPSYPSARGLARGGAFIATADDGAAGDVNPAGLVIPTSSEIYSHLRISEYIHHENAGTRFDPDRMHHHINLMSNLGNFSVSFPLIPIQWLPFFDKHGIAFSLYRNEMINFKNGFFYDQFTPDDPVYGAATAGIISESKIALKTWGAAFATKLGNPFTNSKKIIYDYLAIGLSVKYWILDYSLEQEIYDGGNKNGNVPVDLAYITVANTTDINGSIQVGGVLSFQRLLFLQNVRFGLTMARGGTFEIDATVFTPSRAVGDTQSIEGAFAFPITRRLRIPTWFGAGVSCAPFGKLHIHSDLVYFRYSEQKQVLSFISGQKDASAIVLENKFRFNLGLCYESSERLKCSLGYYRQPNPAFQTASNSPNLIRFFNQEETLHHLTAGCELGILQWGTTYKLYLVASGDLSPKTFGARMLIDDAWINTRELLIAIKLRFQ